MQDNTLLFTPLEESISFYTRNDFAIMNHLMTGNFKDIWKYALLAYEDNQGIIQEYETGIRVIDCDYAIKWLNALRKRTLVELDNLAKERIIQTAKADIENILGAMYPAQEEMLLYRTAWIDRSVTKETEVAYSREYSNLQVEVGSVFEINAISSFSITPYREDEEVGSDFYRYELHVPHGIKVLELDHFITHNEDGEVLLPPMRYKVVHMRNASNPNCKGIIEIDCISSLKEIFQEAE